MSLVKRCIFVFVLLSASLNSYAAWDTIAEGSRICSKDGEVCLSGTIRFERNEKIIVVSTRLSRAPGEGRITLVFLGDNPLGERVRHTVSEDTTGYMGDIVNLKFGPPYSNQTDWWLDDILFAPAE